MRKLLFIAVLAAAAAMSVGWAWAQAAPGSNAGAKAPAKAAFHVPAKLPTADVAQPGSYGYRTSTAIAAKMTGGAAAKAGGAPAAGAASATVTVTAIVLPVVTIVADASGVHEIWTNTDQRDPRDVLFVVRPKLDAGALGTLDAATWAQARLALADANAGSGRIWSA